MPANRDRPPPRMDERQVAEGRRRARRTALAVGAVAVAIYVAFVMSGVIGR